LNIKFVSPGLGIVSCSRDQISNNVHKSQTLIFFYYQKRDWIVFNEEHQDYELFLELIQEYMKLDDQQKKAFIEYIRVPEVRKVIDTINRILRIRRKWYRNMLTA